MPIDRERLKDLFAQAQALGFKERAALLANEEEEVRHEVESLLQSFESAGEFMELPARLGETLAGERVGSYRLVRQIGEGGMGSVYEAVRADLEFEQRVAIKLVRVGLDSDFLRRRFRIERQILARLTHPNIAALLDGGTTQDGRPFLVMEFVEGAPMLDFARERALGLRERLRLFQSVCEAVQFAHRHLVVHRDLKPSNILVTSEGVVKLLDFGIAKALGLSDAATGPQASMTGLLMTPEYSSPEQISRGTITTSSDIYSLGVLLFELVTGKRPFAPTAPHEIARQTCNDEPRVPSAVSQEQWRPAIAGDLDRIILKTLRKEPEQRYASAEHLSADLDRYLRGLPVLARPQTWRYRASKFVRRRKALLATASVAVSIALCGLGMFIWEAGQERRRFNDLRHLANALLFEIYDSIRTLPGSTATRQLVVARAQEYLDSLAKESANDDSLQSELASAYERLGDVQGGYQGANLGQPRAAEANYRKALELRERIRRGDEADRNLLRSHGKLSDLLFQSGRIDEALEHLRASVVLAQGLATRNPQSEKDQRNLAVGLLDYGYKQAMKGEWQEGLDHVRQSIATIESLGRGEGASGSTRKILALAYGREGELLSMREGRLEEAEAAYSKRSQLLEQMMRLEPQSNDVRRMLGWSFIGRGDILARMQKADESIEQHSHALRIFRSLVEADPKDAQSRCDLGFAALGMASSYWTLAQARHSKEDAEHARTLALEAVEALEMGKKLGLIAPQDREAPQEASRLLAKAEGFR